MDWLWVPITVFAAAAQTVRSATQKHLTADLSAAGAAMVRFSFGLPFSLLYLAGVMAWSGRGLPPLRAEFLLPCLATAVVQVLATFLLVLSFSLRSFVVSTTYARTEAALTALLGVAFFGEALSLGGWLAVALGVLGVVLITVARGDVAGQALLNGRSALLGLAAGLNFALAGLFLRQASLSFGDPNFLFTAALTLVTVQAMQVVLLGGYLLIREPRQIGLSLYNWDRSTLAGLSGTLGSIGWFTALTLQQAAYVKLLGQVEFVFTLLASYLLFKERATPAELLGMALVVGGIVLLLAR